MAAPSAGTGPLERGRRLASKAARLRRRRFRAYCLGAAKTGTTSVAAMFAQAARAAHEPDPRATNRLVIDYLEDRVDEATVVQRLRERDRRLRLELESAHPLGYLGGVLARTFPDARFIVTVREPRSWLESRLNFHHKVHPPAWEEYRAYFWTDRHQAHAPEEAVLADYGLCSLDVYLSQYADHYRRVLSELPADRLLVVRTSDLDARAADIATFLGADPERVALSREKESRSKIGPLEQMDDRFVRDRIVAHCRALLEDHFPETLPSYGIDPT